MERMWRKVGGFTGRSSKSSTTIQSDTASAAGFGAENPIQVAAVSGLSGCVSASSNLAVTGRRLASSGDQLPPIPGGSSGISSSFSQHVLHQSTASSERKRRRRRKSRQRSNRERLFGSSRNDSVSNQMNTSIIVDIDNVASVGSNNEKKIERNTNRTSTRDPSLRQRAVAKLRMFNFHLNWDLHMSPCKPCVPRSGNIITRRLCRNRRGEDNELYRSNSFKFERFERKEVNESGTTLHRKISVCDDYSLPIDFVKKRPSSFDPCLAETLPDNWAVIAPSPLSEHVSFLDPPVPAFKHPPITLIQHQQYQQQQQNQQYIQQKLHLIQPQPQYTNITLIEGYSDPKDSRTQPRTARRSRKDTVRKNYNSDSSAPKSSADDDDNKNDNQLGPHKIPELNSPDSISEDLVHPLQPYKSPKRLTGIPEVHKRNPSPYYYSDLLKSKEKEECKEEKSKCRQSTASEPPQTAQTESETPYRKSTSLDVPENIEPNDVNDNLSVSEGKKQEPEKHSKQKSTSVKQKRLHKTLPTPEVNARRYSVTEDGVRIIRCSSPSTTTSDDSDCSECQQRREWHAKALALVRKTCNVQTNLPLQLGGIITSSGNGAELQSVNIVENFGESGDHCNQSMPPHRILGPTVCACTTTTSKNDEVDEYFRPRSVFYVHAQGVHECADCIPEPTGTVDSGCSGKSSIKNINKTKNLNTITTLSSDKSTKSNRSNRSKSSSREHTNEEDNMSSGGNRTGTSGSGRQTRRIYETAFDCKVPKSDDDLDEVVERFKSHNVLLEIGNEDVNLKTKPPIEIKSKSLKIAKSKLRYEGKRQKNTKNQQIQQDNGLNKSILGSVQTLSNEIEHMHIDNQSVQLNNTTNSNNETKTTSNSQLPIRGYTPSPPSTAPLPVKFPGKHEGFLMNSIKSAPSLPSSNPAHPRLRDLRLPIKTIRQQQLGLLTSTGNAAATAPTDDSTNNLLIGSNASSLLDSGTGQMIVNPSSTHSSLSRTRDRPRSVIVLESGRVLELRNGSGHRTMNSNGGHHHHHNHHHGVAIHPNTTDTINKNNLNITQNQQNINNTTTINYSSTESMATSSSGGSMESLRSSTSEGNRSTTSSESRHSTSLSSHSSESGTSVAFPLRAPILLHSKLHILSPISDKSSLEPGSDASELNKKQTPPGQIEDSQSVVRIGQLSNIQEQEQHTGDNTTNLGISDRNSTGHGGNSGGSFQKQFKKRIPQNKALLMLTDEILGSDSGISLHSREDNKIQSAFHRFGLPKLNLSNSDKLQDSGTNSISIGLPQDLRDLPFDMPKLRRRKIILQQDVCTSGSATSVDLGDLPFDMPKLRRRLRMNSQQQQQQQQQQQLQSNNLKVQSTESSGISQASSSHSMDQKQSLESNIFRQNLTLNFNEIKSANNHKFGSLDLRGPTITKGLNLNLSSSGIGYQSAVDLIDVTIPLERQGWYHGAITRIEAESTLRPLSEGSFLVRNCESTKQDYSLSLKGAKGFMHMRIQRNESNQYILGQFSRPFDSVPEMIRHFCINRLPVRGAEHMCLLDPVIVQLL